MIGISARASIARLTAFASAAILTAGLAACASQETEPATPAVEVPANDNLNAVLAAAGCTFADVVDVTLFVVAPESRLDTLMKVLPDYWGSAPYPTLTGVGVTWLSGFAFEIKVVARLPEPNQR